MNSYDDRPTFSGSIWNQQHPPVLQSGGTAPLNLRRQSTTVAHSGPPPSSALPLPPTHQAHSHPYAIPYEPSDVRPSNSVFSGQAGSHNANIYTSQTTASYRNSMAPSINPRSNVYPTISQPRSLDSIASSSSSQQTTRQQLSSHAHTATASPPRHATRPSSRRALIAALELAQEAVQLDSENEDPHAAIRAYSRSVALLKEVMERVMGGEGAGGSVGRANGRARNQVAREEEVRRLRSIHDTYADRMEVLCNLYSIAPPLQIGNEGSSPPPPPHEDSRPAEVSRPRTRSDDESFEGAEGIGDAMFSLDNKDDASIVTATPVRSSILPPIRPPPPGPPPQPPTPSSEGRPTSTSVAPTIIEPPPSHILNNRVAVHRRNRSGGSESNVILEEDEQAERASIRLPPSPSPDPFIVPGPSPTSPTPLPSPSTPRVYDSYSRRSTQESIFATQASTSSAAPLPVPSSYIPSSRPRGETMSSTTSSKSDAATSISTTSERSDSHLEVPDKPAQLSSLVSVSTAQGSIAQRRKSAFPAPILPPPPLPPSHSSGALTSRLTADALPPSTATSLGMNHGRHRSSSQPGRRPSLGHPSTPEFSGLGPGPPPATSALSRPPLPPHVLTTTPSQIVSRKTSYPSNLQTRFAQPGGFSVTVQSPAPPPTNTTSGVQIPVLQGYLQLQQAAAQPPPPTPPVDPLRKPFYLMTMLLASMTSKQGGFITRRLYVPHDVWSQGGAKLVNLSEKGKCVEVLNGALEDVSQGSGEFFRGAGRSNAERWLKVLEEWTSVCESVLSGVGKKLGVGEGLTNRKSSGVTSWGGKFTRTFDRMTSGKSFDSPNGYVHGLAKLFQHAQLFDEHIKAFSNSLQATPYSTLPPDLRHQIESRLKRSSEFFASVVLTWVIRDLGLLLDKYVKKGEKWLAE